MSLYVRSASSTSPTAPNGWKYSSCTLDTGNNRVLTFQSSSSSMTVSTCLSNCAALGSTYGGVENGNECYCGKTLNGGSQLDISRCNSRCGDGQSTGCG